MTSTTLVDQLVRYENDELSTKETVDLFGLLVQTGLAWTLQGHYGRRAYYLVEQGYLSPEGDVLTYDLGEE
jgi:hypothetical protein